MLQFMGLQRVRHDLVTEQEMEKGVKGLCESESDVAQLCLTLCDPMDCSLPASSVHGIFQARILECVAISFSGDLPNPGIEPGSPTL